MAKIADFGVSEQLSNTFNEKRALAGSPFWMAPEAIVNGRNDFRSDIWSLGITSIEMAEGFPPLANLNPTLAMRVIPRSASPVLPDKKYSKQFQDFLAHCVEFDPSKRWTSEKLLTHAFVKKVKREKLKKYLKDAPSDFISSEISAELPAFNGLDGATPHWDPVSLCLLCLLACSRV